MTAGSLFKRLFNARTNVPWVLAMLTGAGIGGSQDMMVRGLLLGLALGLTWAILFGKQSENADHSDEA
ncbi:MAG: hypothetical protein ACLFQ5_13595 [Oceanicaulis sp.]